MKISESKMLVACAALVASGLWTMPARAQFVPDPSSCPPNSTFEYQNGVPVCVLHGGPSPSQVQPTSCGSSGNDVNSVNYDDATNDNWWDFGDTGQLYQNDEGQHYVGSIDPATHCVGINFTPNID